MRALIAITVLAVAAGACASERTRTPEPMSAENAADAGAPSHGDGANSPDMTKSGTPKSRGGRDVDHSHDPGQPPAPGAPSAIPPMPPDMPPQPAPK